MTPEIAYYEQQDRNCWRVLGEEDYPFFESVKDTHVEALVNSLVRIEQQQRHQVGVDKERPHCGGCGDLSIESLLLYTEVRIDD
jgi:hypothetical protein